jgi:hypothetical protein
VRSAARDVTRARSFVIGLVLLVGLAVLLGVAASVDSAPAPPRRLALFGDSLTSEASTYWDAFMEATPQWERKRYSLSGTAICDWHDKMREISAEFRPAVVGFQFVGNDILPCMRADDGSQLPNDEYLRRWRRDTRTAIEIFDPRTTIYLIGPPAMGKPDDRVHDIFEEFAQEYPNTRFVDGGRIVSPNRRFVEHLPCLDEEPCTGPVVDGTRTNVVRSVDRVHFCPDPQAFGQRCTVYSPGAYRFAITLYEALLGTRPPAIDL